MVTADDVRADIDSRADIELLVRTFYGRATVDPTIGHIFTEVARLDLEEHLPIMFDFWSTMLLGDRSYRRNAFAVHAALHQQEPFTPAHFRRWLELWWSTVDELFRGERAEMAKAHATRIAGAFTHRLLGSEGVRPIPLRVHRRRADDGGPLS